MPLIPYILITAVVSVASTVGVVKYLPMSWISSGEPMVLSGAFTDLASSNRLTDFPTTYNANLDLTPNLTTANVFTAGNTFTTSTTTNATTTNSHAFGSSGQSVFNSSGVLSLGTALGEIYGGTDQTTYTTGDILYASSANNLSKLAIGSAGEVLTIAGGIPDWDSVSVNQTLPYTWSGGHIWTASSTHTATTTFSQAMAQGTSTYAGLLPTGSIISYASTTPPDGFLRADGTAISRSTYWQLFAIIGTTYGAGDGSTTFNIPNLNGRNILHASSTANIAQTGGESNHTLTIAEMPAHTHGVELLADPGAPGTQAQDGSGATTNTQTSGSTGGGAAHNVLDPYIVMFAMIKY